jgi:hypothetical protein
MAKRKTAQEKFLIRKRMSRVIQQFKSNGLKKADFIDTVFGTMTYKGYVEIDNKWSCRLYDYDFLEAAEEYVETMT